MIARPSHAITRPMPPQTKRMMAVGKSPPGPQHAPLQGARREELVRCALQEVLLAEPPVSWPTTSADSTREKGGRSSPLPMATTSAGMRHAPTAGTWKQTCLAIGASASVEPRGSPPTPLRSRTRARPRALRLAPLHPTISAPTRPPVHAAQPNPREPPAPSLPPTRPATRPRARRSLYPGTSRM